MFSPKDSLRLSRSSNLVNQREDFAVSSVPLAAATRQAGGIAIAATRTAHALDMDVRDEQVLVRRSKVRKYTSKAASLG